MTQKKKLFGISNSKGKACIYLVFIILTGGFGLIILLIAKLMDSKLKKKSTVKMVKT